MGNEQNTINTEQIYEWNSKENYSAGRRVNYNGRRYQCIQDYYAFVNSKIEVENPEANYINWMPIDKIA